MLRCISFILVLLLLSGCGFKDLDRRFFVLAVGVDKAREGYKVSLELGIPSPKIEPGKANSHIISVTSRSITEAVRLIKSKVDKELDFGHAKMIIFGEELLKEGVPDSIDWFVRRRDIQKVAFMGMGVPTAEAVLAMKPKSERLPGNSLFLSFGQAGTESSYIISEYLFDFFARMTEPGQDPYLPVIDAGQEKDTFVIERVALFDKKNLKVILDPNETRILNTLMYGYDKVDIQSNKKDGMNYFLAVQNYDVKYKLPTAGTPNPTANFNISIKGIAEESTTPLYEKDWKQIEQMMEQAVVGRCEGLLKKLQKLDVDPIGIGLRYRATHHQKDAWEQWQSLKKILQYEVHAKVKLQGTGTVK